MKFINLYILNALWGLILVFVIMAYGISKRKKILTAFADMNMFSAIVPGFSPKRRWIKAILMVLALGCAVVALSGPQMGYKWEKTTQKGVDIMIALDCSKSMLAKDISPNRLERAKREIIDLLRMMRSDRAGLVAFAGNAFLQCPLTLDHEAFNIFLDSLEPGFLPVGGTNLDAAIQTSFDGFEKESDTQKAIIIITDGESTTGLAEQTAQKMAQLGIKIFTIGVGDLQGAPIPDEDGGFKKDQSGDIVLSRVDEKGLEKIASITGGVYVRSVAGDMDLDLIYMDKILGGMEKKEFLSGKKKVWENRYQWFLFPCVFLLLIELMVPSNKQKRVLSVFILMMLFLISSNKMVYAKTVYSSVKEGIKTYNEQQYEQAKKNFIDAQLKDPDNAALYYDIGTAAYKNQEYDQAIENFLQALKTTDLKLRHDALYNLANSYYRAGHSDEAIKGYEDILKQFPDDAQAKENLEFVKRKQEEQKKNQDKNKNKDQDSKDKKKDTDKKDSDKNEQNKNQDKDKGQSKKEDQNKKSDNKQNSDSRKQESQQKSQASDDQKKPGQPEKSDEQTKPADKAMAQKDKHDQQAKQQMERMLNRLEDKPGKAMMPATGKQNIEKDW